MSREVYVIGDIHGDYNIIDARFGDVVGQGNKDNVLFVAGDAGFVNSYENESSKAQRIEKLNSLPFTIIVVLGNHENYDVIESFPEVTIFNGKCYKEDGVDVYYAKNGQIFDIDGIKYFTFNGGLSIDKEHRLELERKFGVKFWWPQEVKTEDFNEAYSLYISKHVDYVITHDIPKSIFGKLVPFIPARFKDQTCPLQDFFQRIYSIKKHTHWYAGHYHPSYKVTIETLTVLPIGHIERIK